MLYSFSRDSRNAERQQSESPIGLSENVLVKQL